MSSNLKVNTILPSTGTTIGIGTVGGLINVVGNIDVNSTSGISTFNGLEISGIVTAKAGAAVTYYGDGSNLTSLPAQATIANNADNRVITGGSGVNLNGESNFTYDGDIATITRSANAAGGLSISNTNNSQASAHARLELSGGDNASAIMRMECNGHANEFIADGNGNLRVDDNGTERLRIDSSGHVMIGTTTEGFATYGDQLTIANTGHCGMTIRSGTSNYGTIYFSDADDGSSDEVRGFIDYNHSNNQLQIGSNAATRLRINSSGTITTPHQFHIEVQRSGDQTGYDGRSSAGGTPVVFNDVVRTRGTAYSALNTSTGKITVPVDGVYFLEASVYTTAGNALSQGWFTEGSSRMTYSDITEDENTDQVQASGMHYLSANTEVGFHPYGATASSITIAANIYHTWFRVTLIG